MATLHVTLGLCCSKIKFTGHALIDQSSLSSLIEFASSCQNVSYELVNECEQSLWASQWDLWGLTITNRESRCLHWSKAFFPLHSCTLSCCTTPQLPSQLKPRRRIGSEMSSRDVILPHFKVCVLSVIQVCYFCVCTALLKDTQTGLCKLTFLHPKSAVWRARARAQIATHSCTSSFLRSLSFCQYHSSVSVVFAPLFILMAADRTNRTNEAAYAFSPFGRNVSGGAPHHLSSCEQSRGGLFNKGFHILPS